MNRWRSRVLVVVGKRRRSSSDQQRLIAECISAIVAVVEHIEESRKRAAMKLVRVVGMGMRQLVTRRYASDAHYTADAAHMAAAGWRVVSLQREPSGAILASYALNPAAAGSQAFRQARPWYRSASGRAFTIGFALFLVAMLVAVWQGFVIANSGIFARPPDGLVPSTEATNQAFTSALDATATANAVNATATPQPSRVSGPHLGAPLSDFDAAFGKEQGAGVWYAMLSGQSVMLTAQTNAMGADTSDPITTPDGLDRVWTVSVSYLGPTAPTLAQNAAICRQFMPPDAQHISDNSNSPTLEHIYRSQLLAASFDANAFQNNNSDDVTPGTFDVFYFARACSLNTGQE